MYPNRMRIGGEAYEGVGDTGDEIGKGVRGRRPAYEKNSEKIKTTKGGKWRL